VISSGEIPLIRDSPARLLDTRNGTGLSGAFISPVARTFAVTGNLTVTNQTSAGFVALTPDPTNNPTTSTLNFPIGDNWANGVTVALSGTGTLSATYSGKAGRSAPRRPSTSSTSPTTSSGRGEAAGIASDEHEVDGRGRISALVVRPLTGGQVHRLRAVSRVAASLFRSGARLRRASHDKTDIRGGHAGVAGLGQT